MLVKNIEETTNIKEGKVSAGPLLDQTWPTTSLFLQKFLRTSLYNVFLTFAEKERIRVKEPGFVPAVVPDLDQPRFWTRLGFAFDLN